MLHSDRWLEMDLIWFDPDQALDPQIDLVLERLKPLWASTDGLHGLCLNIGWLIDLVTEWTGDPAQKLPLRSRNTAAWAKHSYDALRAFFAQLRAGAARNGLGTLKVGVLFVGWARVVWPPDIKIYDFQSDWYDRHPELYGGPNTIIGMPDLWPVNRLKADKYPYATQPGGLAEGTYFPELFGAQWGALSRFLGINALHLRDGMTGPMVYTRTGPYGAELPPDVDWRAWTYAVIDLYRAIKQANPETFLIGYSSAISAVADWRVGCIDLEALVADGAIDAWIDQTWGGAWQDWWHQLWKGWTFQLANLLGHRVQIEAGNTQRKARGLPSCKHYHLIETWDGWEPWDTLHQVPDKLRWGIWAFAHAAALTPDGLRTTDGVYISWANHRSGKLLSAADVAYLQTHMDAAGRSAAQLEHIYGPVGIYNRSVLEWLMAGRADQNASEWIEDQIGMLCKWGVPCLGMTRAEWLPALIDSLDGLIAQVPGQLPAEARDTLTNTRKPVLCIGRADVIDPAVLARCGAALAAEAIRAKGFVHLNQRGEIAHLPPHRRITPLDNAATLLDSDAGPLLVQRANMLYWQPPDWSEPGNAQLPKYQLGSTLPHALAAAALRQLLPWGPAGDSVAWEAPATCHMWRSGGRLYVLLGNLETGVLGDSRTPRHVTLALPDSGEGNLLQRVDADAPAIRPRTRAEGRLIFQLELAPQGAAVYVLDKEL